MIEIRWKCACTPAEQVFWVRERQPEQDIKSWMEKILQPALGGAHQQASLTCRQTAVEYIKIPHTENSPIGTKPRKEAP